MEECEYERDVWSVHALHVWYVCSVHVRVHKGHFSTLRFSHIHYTKLQSLVFKFFYFFFKFFHMIYDPIQRFIKHFGNPFTIDQIQFHPFIWPHFLITFNLSNLAFCTLDLDLDLDLDPDIQKLLNTLSFLEFRVSYRFHGWALFSRL